MNIAKSILLIFVFICFGLTGYSQKVDYKIVRDTITRLSCKSWDSLTIVKTNEVLKKINIELLDKNLDLYYRDLGWSYYRLYLYTNDTVLIRNSIKSYEKADSCKTGDPSTLWELGHLHYILKECILGAFYIDKFKKVTDKEYWREDQIKLMMKRCDN